MNVQKLMIINGLKAWFVGVTRLLINVPDKTMIVETKDGTRTEPAKYSEYFVQVCEAYGLKTITTIFINFDKKEIVLKGKIENVTTHKSQDGTIIETIVEVDKDIVI